MNFRKYKNLVIGGGIALALVLITAYFLVRNQLRYARVKEDLERTGRNLRTLYQRKPFPSDENVAIEKQNLKTLNEQFTNILQAVEKSYIDAPPMESAEFSEQYLIRRNRMVRKAREAGVQIPVDFTFGFEKYAGGNLPGSPNVGRLSIQLEMVQRLVDLLIENNVSSIEALDRQVFEDAALGNVDQQDRNPRGGRLRVRRDPTPKPVASSKDAYRDDQNLLYGERFTLEFTAKESRLWDLLNALSGNDMFITITRLEVRNDRKPESYVVDPASLVEIPQTMDGAALPERPLPREERIIAGRESLQVKMEIEIIRFTHGEEVE